MTSTSLPDLAKPSAIHGVPKPKPEPTLTPTVHYELHPRIVIFIAGFIAFHLAAALTAMMAECIYYWQNLGGFAP